MSMPRTSTPHRHPLSRPPLKRENLVYNNCSDIMADKQSSPKLESYKTRSPIAFRRTVSREDFSENETDSETDEESEDAEIDFEPATHLDSMQSKTVNNGIPYFPFFALMVGAMTMCVGGIYMLQEETGVEQEYNISQIITKFPNQGEHFWKAIESGVQDVVTFNRPAVFTFLYEEEAAPILQKILKELTKYITCKISECNEDPIILGSEYLNSNEVKNDFGIILEKFGHDLQDKGLVIVENLEKVSGTSAQVFHTLCDEYSPFVPRSLFIFTMKLNKLPSEHNLGTFVENYLTKQWKGEIKQDLLQPLLTRIINMPLTIVT